MMTHKVLELQRRFAQKCYEALPLEEKKMPGRCREFSLAAALCRGCARWLAMAWSALK